MLICCRVRCSSAGLKHRALLVEQECVALNALLA
jgi:hypothetical protein